ncbi:MAG: isoprenylcysteine carboxylmethyltransferase family protein [Rhodospirillaceae bacterium]|nr:isoprenylcysteine carboxylmethyltransferase family protein [Rhodospirillaceae bacterium]
MNTYQRLFGTGPRGLLLGLLMLYVAWWGEKTYGLGSVHGSVGVGWAALIIGSVITAVILFWAVKSLPPSERGKNLITTGAFKYFRHPLYAAFLLGFGPGLVFYLDGWFYILSSILQFPMWHWNIRAEEKLMANAFPREYEQYCQHTGRFFPKLWW